MMMKHYLSHHLVIPVIMDNIKKQKVEAKCLFEKFVMILYLIIKIHNLAYNDEKGWFFFSFLLFVSILQEFI